MRRNLFRFAALTLTALAGGRGLLGQGQGTAAKPEPDVLVFTNGEKLIGHFEHSNGSSITFKSDMAGEVTVDWTKVKEFHSSQKLAVIPKNVRLGKNIDTSNIPQGTLSMSEQKLVVTPAPQGPPRTIPVGDAAHIVDQATFQRDALHNPGFFNGWTGAVAAGASLVEATQKSHNFTGAINLVRAIPPEDWLEPRNRTIIDFSESYGKVSEPGTPTVKTDIIHADVERDEYFTSRLYGFGHAAWDHNFSQGLDLQQTYGGGIGWTAYKTDNEELDFKGSIDYIKQDFTEVPGEPSQDQNLIGSVFGETYHRNFAHGIVLAEGLSITPAFNEPSAYSALGNVTLSLPLYKHFNLAFGVVDSYLNNPPVGFKKNSFQFTAALAYSIP
ncbi:MAG TPA: DUF481 domain-containing protein [Bryobacteraceae bacterium]|jgi:hypothetical protein